MGSFRNAESSSAALQEADTVAADADGGPLIVLTVNVTLLTKARLQEVFAAAAGAAATVSAVAAAFSDDNKMCQWFNHANIPTCIYMCIYVCIHICVSTYMYIYLYI